MLFSFGFCVVSASLTPRSLVALLAYIQSDEEEILRKLLFRSTRCVRPFRQGSEKEHGTEPILVYQL